MNVGFIGLGAMGSAMATSLLGAGHAVTVYNRARDKAEPFRERGAHIAATPSEAAAGAEVVVTMLADDPAVEHVTLGENGVLAGLATGAVHVSCSTISLELAQRLAAAHVVAGKGYVAAPVFGRPDAAAAKKLWVLAAGPDADVERAWPILEAMGRGITRLGHDVAAANVVKLTGNFIIASMVETLGEAFAFTRKAGVPPEAFLDVFTSVFARSPVFEGYATLVANERYEPAAFKLPLMLKDLRLALAASESLQAPLPIASLVRDALVSAQAQGKGDKDWSVIAQLAAERAGLQKRQ